MDRPVIATSSGLSAGAVAAIAVFSTLVGAFFIACLCLILSRRRQRNVTLQHEVSQIPNFDWEEIETNTTDARQPKKLQKQRKDWTHEAIANTTTNDNDSSAESSEGGEALMREVSPVRPMPLPQLPPFKKSLFTSVFRGGSSPARSIKSSRTNKSGSPERPEKAYRQRDWIDEDVLHGPKVKMQIQTDQAMARDSWPLYSKLASPTLPVVLSNDVQRQTAPYQFQGVGSQYQPCYQPHFPTTLQYSMPAPQLEPQPQSQPHLQMQQQQMPQLQQQYMFHPSQQYNGQGQQRYLPLPPRPVLITGNSVSQAMGNQYYDMQQLLQQSKAFAQHAQAQQAASAAAAAASASGPARKASSTRAAKRKASTDSTLSEILKSTEERLMQSSPTRSRPTTSGTSSTETIKRVRYSNENEDEQPKQRSASQVKLFPVTYSGSKPKKFTFSASFERRDSDGSEESDTSEDSTFGLPVVLPENELPTQLSSPHRTPTKTHDKSPSGSLSTIADEGEEEAESLKLEEMEARYLNQIAALSAKTPTPVNTRSLKAKSMPGLANNDPFVSPSSSPTKKTTPQSARTNRETIRRIRSLRTSTFGEPSPPPLLPAPPKPNTGKHLSTDLEQRLPNQAALGVLPLDLYALRTPVRQTAVKSPTIVPADPSNPNSVHAKKVMQSTSRASLSAPESPSSEVKMEIAKATIPGLRLSRQAGNDGKKPVQANTSSPRTSPEQKTKAVPPPHELRPKGSSPTLGSYGGLMKSIRGPAPPISLVTPKAHRRSVSIKLSGAGSGRVRSMSGVSRQSSTLSQASSVYSQESVGELPQITVNRASVSTATQSPHNPAEASPPVVATVAALRRMNSVVSTGSGPSESGSPVIKTTEFVVARRHRKGRGSKGSRNYLGLLEMKGLNLPTVEGKEKASPEKMKENVNRASVDSLGLYDDDGFLISSPVRGGRSP